MVTEASREPIVRPRRPARGITDHAPQGRERAIQRKSLRVERAAALPQRSPLVRVRKQRGHGLGKTAGDVASDLDVALAGRVVARVRVEDRSIGVRVRLPDELRFDPEKVRSWTAVEAVLSQRPGAARGR